MQIVIKFEDNELVMTKHEYPNVRAEYVDVTDSGVENDVVTIVVSKKDSFPKQEDFIKAGMI